MLVVAHKIGLVNFFNWNDWKHATTFFRVRKRHSQLGLF